MSFDIHENYSKMSTGEVLLAYKGNITSELIINVLNAVEAKLDSTIEKSNVRKKVYNVLVESLQNMYHHIENPQNNGNDEIDLNFGIFVVSREDDTYKISTGNFVHIDQKDNLKQRIDKINAMSKEELKTLYKSVLNNQKFSEKGGGGLGLIDIARKTGNKLDYSFDDYNDDYYFFNLNMFIS